LLEKTIYTRERRGLLIGSGRIPEPSMPRNNYTTEGKASPAVKPYEKPKRELSRPTQCEGMPIFSVIAYIV